jgi:hypothetical protein
MNKFISKYSTKWVLHKGEWLILFTQKRMSVHGV